MRINLLFTIFVIMTACIFLFLSDQASSLDITRILQGTVKGIKGNTIKVIENSNGKEFQVMINPNTVYDNVQELADLRSGDEIQVDYKMNQNMKIAIAITKLEIEN